MTGQELKLTYMSIGWTGRKAAEELGFTESYLYQLTKKDEIDKRTEYAILYLKEHKNDSTSD